MIPATLTISAFLNQLDTLELPTLEAPQKYADRSFLKLFLYAQIHKIMSFKLLAKMTLEKPDLQQLCNLKTAPHRTTISRRFKSLPDPLALVLDQLTEKAQEQELIDITITSTDSTLMKANGNLWHKKNMIANEIPKCGNIDTDAHWGKSGCKGWTFGYALFSLVACGPLGIVWPLESVLYPANAKDAPVFKKDLLRHLPSETQLLLADSGFDDQHLANCCNRRKITLVSPILKVGKNSPKKRLARAALFATPDVREAFVLRKTSVEPFQGQIKDVFGLERLPVKGLLNVRALCVLAVVTYCLLVLFNVGLGRSARAIKETMYLLA
jgi:transposase